MPINLHHIQASTITGPDAAATVHLVEVDDLDRPGATIHLEISLLPAERQALQDIVQRARRRLTRRLDAARAARTANPAAPVNLYASVANEDAQ
jgi:hypothetical protein